MKRVLVALCITVGLSAAGIALIMATGERVLRPEAESFMKRVWSDDYVDVIGTISPETTRITSMQRIQQEMEFYRFLLGDYIGVEEVISSEITDEGSRSVLVLRVAFENATTLGTFEFEKVTTGIWMVKDFDFEMPAHLEPGPQWKKVLINTTGAVHRYGKGDTDGLHGRFNKEYRTQVTREDLAVEHEKLFEGLELFEEAEYLGHEEAPEGRRKMSWRLKYKNGNLRLDLTIGWAFAEGLIHAYEVRKE